MAWAPPAADSDWTPPSADRDTSGASATADYSDDDSPEAMEAKGQSSAAEAALHFASSNLVAPVARGLGYVGGLTGLMSGGAEEAANRAGAAATYEPKSEQAKAATDVVGSAVSDVAQKASDVAGGYPVRKAAEESPFVGQVLQNTQDVASLLPVAGVGMHLADRGRVIPAAAPKTAPAAPEGYTIADFAPKPATEAAQAPTEAPTPGTPSTPPPEAAKAAPSAAPDAAGKPAPDVHDPDFFPKPDNQGLKSESVSAEEQAARKAAVERGAPTLPQVRDSAITNNTADQHRDWAGNQARDPVATAQIAAENQALHQEAGRISSATGGQLGTGESADTVRGKGYQDWHDTTVDALKKHIDATYTSEDANARQIATPGSDLKGVLTNDALIDSADAGHVRNSTIALGKQMGVDLTDPNAMMNAYQVEQLRKHAGSLYGNAPRLAQAIKNAADADLPQGAYQQARALNKIKSQMFDNNDGINQLGASKEIDPDTGKPRPENRPVKAPDVMKKIEAMDPGQVQHIMRTMKASSSILDRLGDKPAATAIAGKALKAAQQIQSHFTERWGEEASKGGGWNQRRADQFLRGNQETLASIMSPEQMHKIRNVHNAANVLDLDKGYKGAAASFAHSASWLRRVGGTLGLGAVEAGLAKATLGGSVALKEGLNVATGGKLDRALSDVATGARKPPANFTRPLGAKIGGGNQRGAVGLLNKPGIVHEFDPDTGVHRVESPNGVTEGDAVGKNIRVGRTDTEQLAQGGGEGTLRMARLADEAHSQGGLLHSDISVSPSQEKTYGALSRMGYDVKKNPNAERSETTGNLVSDDVRKPIFTVGPRNPLSRPQAPRENVPLGLRIGGGRQAGAVGDLGAARRPKAEAPLASAADRLERLRQERNAATGGEEAPF
jgi:hypothetical protein